jgi:hypothetical protein
VNELRIFCNYIKGTDNISGCEVDELDIFVNKIKKTGEKKVFTSNTLCHQYKLWALL